jgi:hypothetical protein
MTDDKNPSLKKYFVTRYFLSTGKIWHEEGTLTSDNRYLMVKRHGHVSFLGLRDWSATKYDAEKRCEEMSRAKLDSLDKQRDKVLKLAKQFGVKV